MHKIFFVVILIFLYYASVPAQNKNISIQSVNFDSALEIFDGDELRQVSGLQNSYNPDLNIRYAAKMEEYLRQKGYLYARISRIAARYNQDSSSVNLEVSGKPGSLVLFGNISVTSDSIDAILYQNLLTVQKNDTYSQSLLENDIKQMLSFAADSGYVYARAEISKMAIENIDDNLFANVDIHIHEGEIITINDIKISGNNYTKPYVILRELPVKKGNKYSKSAIERIPQKLMRIGIFKDVKPASVVINDKGNYVLSLKVIEGNATTFDGVAGYIPENKNTASGRKSGGYFTGLVDLTFNNLFGTARRFDVHWEKPDRQSENFYLRYTEPWLLQYPIDVSVGLERTVRDTTYIEWKGQLQSTWHYSDNFSVISSLQRQVVLPDSVANRNLRLVRYEQYNLEVGIQYDTRDYPINPRKGIFIGHSYTFGFKNNYGPGYLLREDSIKTKEQIELIKLNFYWFKQLFNNQVFALKLSGNVVRSDRLQITDLIWFGGARTLRGYRENQFQGDIASWMNLEYRFLLARNSRIFLFNDWGAYRYKLKKVNRNDILYGYGIGIRLDTALGILGVDFGLGKGDSFSEAKIHFGIINRF